MQKEGDVQLIRKILSGDDAAFGILVEKYQKSIHTLVWRKIGDYHYAEEIMQDVFLKAYKKLPTLKNPNQFAGWLHVMANRLCIDWIRKQTRDTEATAHHAIAGGYTGGRNRGILLYTPHIRTADDRENRVLP